MTSHPTDFSASSGPAEEALASQLARIAAEADPVPSLVFESAFAALAMRRIDAELAKMVHDSEVDGLAGVRGAADDADGGVRRLAFEAPGLSISAQISSSPESRSLLGQVAGADVSAVTVQTPREQLPAQLGEAGVFRLDNLPTGSLRLLVNTPRGEVVGDWITV
jgi:hypothetical protein